METLRQVVCNLMMSLRHVIQFTSKNKAVAFRHRIFKGWKDREFFPLTLVKKSHLNGIRQEFCFQNICVSSVISTLVCLSLR